MYAATSEQPEALPMVEVMGCSVHNINREEAVGLMLDEAQSPTPTFAVTPNVDHVIMLRRNAEFRAAYDRASIITADGMPLLWAAKLKKTPLKQRVCGSDLVDPLCEGAVERGLSIYLLGGRPGAADEAAKRLSERFPGLKIAGTACPPMGFHADPEQNDKVIAAVREARPDILFVGLGAPKQELWMNDNLERLGVPFSIGVGASIEFTAGYVQRAPGWMQNSGLEWAYRIYRDRKLVKRYLWNDLPFITYLARLSMLRAVGKTGR